MKDLPLPPSPSPTSPAPSPPWPPGRGWKVGRGTLEKKSDQVTKKPPGRKIISGLDLICQHVVIVHFDFGQKWKLVQQAGVVCVCVCGRGCSVPPPTSDQLTEFKVFTTSKYTFCSQLVSLTVVYSAT